MRLRDDAAEKLWKTTGQATSEGVANRAATGTASGRQIRSEPKKTVSTSKKATLCKASPSRSIRSTRKTNSG
jgi:hypothetical protein